MTQKKSGSFDLKTEKSDRLVARRLMCISITVLINLFVPIFGYQAWNHIHRPP